ncbi:MAG: hypothetical protein S4CHLAM7_15320 [Chlamydiae bacterium]|nr:hypothetical protein [Chlamydiota bacterium]
MSKNTQKNEAQNPLILRYQRLMDAFSKSDDEREFYLDKQEGFIVYSDLDRAEDELEELEVALDKERFFLIPKLTFYETKKIMEGFINEKIYDIDIKEKLADIIQSKEAKENFLEFVYDHDVELEKWQQFYQERSRVRIIEWLRKNDFQFVFEEDLDLAPSLIEKVKQNLFNAKVAKDVATARQLLEARAKVYYSNEALNPRPKRGRPPKQVAKVEVEPQLTNDFYTTVPPKIRTFLYVPDITSTSAITFSSKFDMKEESKAQHKLPQRSDAILSLESISKKLSSLSDLSKKVSAIETEKDIMETASAKRKNVPKSAASRKRILKSDEGTVSREAPQPLKNTKTPKEKNFLKRLIKKNDDDKKKTSRSILKRARRIIKKDKES